jgi:hypothetical protein
MIFHDDFVVLEDNRIVPIKYIESMRDRTDEDRVMDVLKDEYWIDITMISGKDYAVNLYQQRSAQYYIRTDQRGELQNIYLSFVNEWRDLIEGR